MPSGEIQSAYDGGTVWLLYYKKDEGGVEFVPFDHTPFGYFYEGATGRSFYKDYKFGAGKKYVSDQLRGRRIRVQGEEWEWKVSLED
jgi:hypothetical protein